MCAPDPPEPPDPKETAAGQTSTNLATAQANAILGNVNQVTPDGSLTYSQSGQRFISDPIGGQTYWQGPGGEIRSSAPAMVTTPGASRQPIYQTVSGRNGERQILVGYRDGKATSKMPDGWSQVKGYYIPQYTATQTLSPEGAAIKKQTDAAKLNLGELAASQSSFLKDWLSKPVDLSNDATEARLMDLGMKRLQPALDARRASNEADLINRGIRPGSDAYAQAQGLETQSENDAYNQLLLAGRGQSVQEALAQNSAPINNLTALLSGTQVSQPNFVNSNMPTIPTTDYAGLVNTNYNQKLQNWQNEASASSDLFGGLFGLGANLIKFSDRRLKKNIRAIGTFANGLTKYVFEYLWSDAPQIGVMADEVRTLKPYAVKSINGFDAVNYGEAFA